MRYTPKADHALFLGCDLARAYHSSFESRYFSYLPTIRERLCNLDLDSKIQLPDEHHLFASRFSEFVATIQNELAEERRFLGGDGYAFPFFVLAISLHITLTAMATGQLPREGLAMISNALLDLGVRADEARLEDLLRLETEWIQTRRRNDEFEVDENDIRMAWSRMAHQLLERWLAGQRRAASDLPEISIEDIPLYTCFISYSSSDEVFCNHLYETLRLKGVRVWYAPDKMIAGEKITRQLDKGLETYDKVVLVLSEKSMHSDWVRYEIATAVGLSRTRGENVLVPVSLMNPERLKGWELHDPETNRNLAEYIQGMLVANFTQWAIPDQFESNLEQLLRALRRLDQEPPLQQQPDA